MLAFRLPILVLQSGADLAIKVRGTMLAFRLPILVLQSGADLAIKVRGMISVIFGIQVS